MKYFNIKKKLKNEYIDESINFQHKLSLRRNTPTKCNPHQMATATPTIVIRIEKILALKKEIEEITKLLKESGLDEDSIELLTATVATTRKTYKSAHPNLLAEKTNEALKRLGK